MDSGETSSTWTSADDEWKKSRPKDAYSNGTIRPIDTRISRSSNGRWFYSSTAAAGKWRWGIWRNWRNSWIISRPTATGSQERAAPQGSSLGSVSKRMRLSLRSHHGFEECESNSKKYTMRYFCIQLRIGIIQYLGLHGSTKKDSSRRLRHVCWTGIAFWEPRWTLLCNYISFFPSIYIFLFFLIYFYSYTLVYRSPTRFAKSLSVYFFSTRNPSAEVTQGPRTFWPNSSKK